MIDLSKLAGKSVLITGSTGLIGSALVSSLRDTKAVIFTPDRYQLADKNIQPQCDIVLHCAGYGQPSQFMNEPLSTLTVNTESTRSLLSRMKPSGSFLFCSSSEIYSGLDKLATEDDIGTTTPGHPRACYIEGKRCGEAFVNTFRQAGRRAFSARIASTYGPGTRLYDAKVMSQFIQRALVDHTIILRDSGEAIRTYGYITDIVEMLWNIVLHGSQSVYNVGGKSVTTIANLAKQIGRLTGAEVVIPKDIPDSIGGAKTVRIDLTRYESEFGKTDYVTLDEGLVRTIKYQRGLYNG